MHPYSTTGLTAEITNGLHQRNFIFFIHEIPRTGTPKGVLYNTLPKFQRNLHRQVSEKDLIFHLRNWKIDIVY